ncbi:glycoside hydrolase family 3 protein [Criblamydia sequanensis]|uniref:beta-N-acetylhexosaminidase n=1 Tax=Candidatus Criblamydia sequanensis CRIB-18 TaxID=1437425 RepID=A0A090D335_9BACT|nr:glycoside hydrolase family 3 N-terminal domain-containing protein [Criblamydia sequanensis]CDR34893.1 Glycosyl hydrolase [Criblamydia sequanensis CRIB-18]
MGFSSFYSSFLLVIFLPITLIANENISWAERTLASMSTDEKIGQLFMIAGYVDSEFAAKEIGNPHIIEEIEDYITRYHVGGIAFVGPSLSQSQVSFANRYQKISKYPILIAQDLEWGLSMRLKDGMGFPKNITLGAIKNNDLIYQMGLEIGRQAKLIGVHMNLSPVLDVNTEPENPVINVRSFGSTPQEVARKGRSMIRGLQDAGIIASAKHFPGLGDIIVDPHLGLPYCKHEKKRLEEIELFPFIEAIKEGVLSIQTEHLIIPAFEDLKIPASLSQKVVQGLLKEKLGFRGLVLSGALRMKALTDFMSEEEIVLRAFLAGSDMLLMPQDFPKAYNALKLALKEGKINEKDIDERVLTILKLKEKVNLDLDRFAAIPNKNDLHTASSQDLRIKLFQEAVSILRNERKLIPLSQENAAYVQLGEASTLDLLNQLKLTLNTDSYFCSLDKKNIIEEERLFKNMEKYGVVILAIFPADPRRIAEIRLMNENKQKEELRHFRVHGITDSLASLIRELKPYEQKIIVAYFGNPFGLYFFDDYSTLIMGYEEDSEAQIASWNLMR